MPITERINSTNLHLYERCQSVVLQTDGKLVLAGYSVSYHTKINGYSSDFALARYNSDGSLDRSFNGNGKVITDFGFDAMANSVLVQTDGKLVVAGDMNLNGVGHLILGRYNPDGSLDTGFNGNGSIVSTAEFYDDASTSNHLMLTQQADGKLVAVGTSKATSDADFILTRYNADGSLDTTFGKDGLVTTDFMAINNYAGSVIIQPDGKLVVAGTSYISSYNGGNYYFALARYNSDGSLDTGFGDGGKVTSTLGVSAASSVVIQSDGKLVVAGAGNNDSRNDFILSRYNTDGSLDTTFDGDGIVTTNVGSWFGSARALVVQPDGKLVVTGSAYSGHPMTGFPLVRYNTDGSLDSTFGDNGKVININTTVIGYSNTYSANALIIQPDGKLVVAGENKFSTSIDSSSYSFAIARYNSDGSADNSFNGMPINPLMGTENSDLLSGTAVNNDQIMGLAGNDTLLGLAGNDTLDGGANIDTVLYNGVRGNFTVQRATTDLTFTVTDKVGSEGIDTLIGIEKIQFSDNIQMRLDVSGTPGQAYRIYQAAFDRKPDLSGLGFWIDAMDKGTSLQTVANGFVNSSEFQTMYGLNPSPDTFLTKLYNNVLHRAYDQSGFDFWLSTLNSGANSQATVLAQFSESPENQDATLGLIGNGVEYTPYFAL